MQSKAGECVKEKDPKKNKQLTELRKIKSTCGVIVEAVLVNPTISENNTVLFAYVCAMNWFLFLKKKW